MRNHPLWNPRVARLNEIEDDDAGKLRAFRERYGRAWDNRVMAERDVQVGAKAGAAKAVTAATEAAMEDGEVGEEILGKPEAGGGKESGVRPRQQPVDNLMDLISGGYEQLSKNPRLGLKKKKGIDTAGKPAHAGTGAGAAKKPGAK